MPQMSKVIQLLGLLTLAWALTHSQCELGVQAQLNECTLSFLAMC